MLTAAYLTTSLVVLAVGARYLLAGRHIDEARTMLRMAIGMLAVLGAAAALHRRPARAQHAQASADQDRGDGGALGRQQAGRLVLFAWPDAKTETNLFEISIPQGRIADPHP